MQYIRRREREPGFGSRRDRQRHILLRQQAQEDHLAGKHHERLAGEHREVDPCPLVGKSRPDQEPAHHDVRGRPQDQSGHPPTAATGETHQQRVHRQDQQRQVVVMREEERGRNGGDDAELEDAPPPFGRFRHKGCPLQPHGAKQEQANGRGHDSEIHDLRRNGDPRADRAQVVANALVGNVRHVDTHFCRRAKSR